MNLPPARTIANALSFQLVWFVCAQGSDWLALAATSFALLLHWRFIARPREWQLWLAALLLGIAVDSAMIALDVLRFPTTQVIPPPWLLCMWVMLSTTLLHSMAYLERSFLLAGALGAIGGPLAYFGGAQFSGASLGFAGTAMTPWPALAVLAITWALVMPCLMLAAKHCDGDGARKFS